METFDTGAVLGTLALTAVVFVGVSFAELKRKIDDQLAEGTSPYELKVDKRPGKAKATVADLEPPKRQKSNKAADQSYIAEPGFRNTTKSGKKSKKKR